MQIGLSLALTRGGGRARVATATPTNTAVPVISGIKTNGQTLSASNGTWDQPFTSAAYQWKRGGTNIASATNSTYLLTGTDVGTAITVAVTVTNSFGTSTAATSAATSAIAAVLSLSGTPSSSGTVGGSYSFTPTRAGGHSAYSYALTGTLPGGLSFSTSAGAITGTLTTAQTASGLNITVTDADGLTASLGAFSITVAASDTTAPTITSANTDTVAENATLSHALTADETVTWSITGGADQAKFELSGSTLRWASNGTKNFEAPDDANTDNAYVVQVTATDLASNATAQTITVTVTDVVEGASNTVTFNGADITFNAATVTFG